MTKGRSTGLGIVAFAAALMACEASPTPETEARVRVDTVDGVPHVISGDPGAWGEGESWTLPDSGVVIGVMDGAAEEVLGEVAGVAVDEEGRIWVADDQAKEIRVFDPDGVFLRVVGREGEGPGEFRNLSGLARAPGGVAALDGVLARVTVFDAEGGVVRSFRLERPYMILMAGAPMAFDQAGRFFDRTHLSTRPPTDSIGVVTYSPAGEPVDTALIAAIEPDALLVERDGRPIFSFPRPFAPRASLAFGPDGTVYLARGDRYRVDVLSPAGDTLRVIRREIAPRPVSAEERDAAMAAIAERYEEVGQKAPAGIALPETKPAIEALRVDRAGNLWVLTHSGTGETYLEWAVHGPDGRYLGDVATPAMNVMDIGEDHVAGVTWDELGVQRVRVVPLRK